MDTWVRQEILTRSREFQHEMRQVQQTCFTSAMKIMFGSVFRARKTDEIEVFGRIKRYAMTSEEDGTTKFCLTIPSEKLRRVKKGGPVPRFCEV